MVNAIQLANELETFKRMHKGGSLIDDAVSTIRRQHEELVEAESMRHAFTLLLRFVKRICGRRMCKIGFYHFNRKNRSIEVLNPKIAEINNYDTLIRTCEEHIPNSGVYGTYV